MCYIDLQRRNKPCVHTMSVFSRYVKWYDLGFEESKAFRLIKLLAPSEWHLMSIENMSLYPSIRTNQNASSPQPTSTNEAPQDLLDYRGCIHSESRC